MAIAPNTTFVSGAVLTAAQQNAFGFSTMAYNSTGTAATGITSIAAQITLSSFTAIANRNYKITYFEPSLVAVGSAGEATLTIKNGATTLNQSVQATTTAYSAVGLCVHIGTFTAGSVTITGNLTNFGSTSLSASRQATRYAFVHVEDIGPA